MKRFGTQGRVYPDKHYVVRRHEEISDFLTRVDEGRYIVLFAPRQTGKTTFFRLALETLREDSQIYLPIQLNFEAYQNLTRSEFYETFCNRVIRDIRQVYQNRNIELSESLSTFLDNTKITNHISMMDFFEDLSSILIETFGNQKVVIIIDEFDGIPQAVLIDFLHSLREIYLSDQNRCPHSVGIIGVKSIAQLNYDRSISPFNIQDEFFLHNFSLQQVQELMAQYTAETGQSFSSDVIVAIHKQTAGQPFLVNRFGQILTEELEIPKTDAIAMSHFSTALSILLEEDNVNIRHILTNIQKDPRFENILMNIVSYERGVQFNQRNEIIDQLSTYGVIAKGADGMCEIANPIYKHCIFRSYLPLINGVESHYFDDDSTIDFEDYLTHDGKLEMDLLLNNFKDFIARAGFKILNIADTPREFVGQNLLYAYLDQFVRIVGAVMYLEVQTGRGRIDLLILHNLQKYVIETKIWENQSRYQAGKRQLATYLKLENVNEGYYVVFDHRANSESLVETESIDGFRIQSYVIPVVQERPSSV